MYIYIYIYVYNEGAPNRGGPKNPFEITVMTIRVVLLGVLG